MTESSDKKRTIFILYVPGGAMLGVIPWVVLNRIEELTETPAAQLFQAFEGVSSGALVVASQNVQGMSSAQSLEHFCEKAPASLPEIPGRRHKMLTSQIIDLIQDNVDPERMDDLLIAEIKSLCSQLEARAPVETKSEINTLEKAATKKWLTRTKQKKLYKHCEKLAADNPQLEDLASQIGELVWARSHNNVFSISFKKASLGLMGSYRKSSAAPEKYLFDANQRKQISQEQFAERRMSDFQRSIYISTYDASNNKVKIFSTRRHDYFSLDPDTPVDVSEGNHKIWDALMASTANPYGFPPHRTEDGTLCIDKAAIHPPLAALKDALAHKPDDADIKFVILGTGKHLRTLPAHSAEDYYLNKGIAGNFLNGREIAEAESYIMSMTYELIESLLGPDHIIEISPEFNTDEYSKNLDIPSQDSLNGSEDYKRKTFKQARTLLVREDEKIRQLAQMLVDNLHLIGHMDDEKHQHISQKIGVTSSNEPLNSGIGKNMSRFYDSLKFKPGLKDVFRKWVRSSNQHNTSSRPQPPPSRDDEPSAPKKDGPGPSAGK